MTCPTCRIGLRKVLLKQAGVSAVVVHYQRKQLDVVYEDSQVSAAALMRTAASVGFPAQVHFRNGPNGRKALTQVIRIHLHIYAGVVIF